MAVRERAFRNDRFTEKERRNLAILDIIRRTRQISRAEISKITHLNIVTISNYIDDYIAKGLVLERGYDVSTGGRRPELLDLNAKYGYAIGVDLGSPHIMEDSCAIAVMIDAAGKIISKVSVKKEEESQDKFIEKIRLIVRETFSKSGMGKEKLKGIGIGSWGVLDRYKGVVRYAVEKGGLFNYANLQMLLEKEFDAPTIVEHDATAGALGEKWMGLGLSTEAENIIYMCSDSGCGLILNGEIYYGTSKSAGELNINPPSPDFHDDNCWATYDHGCGFRSRGIDLGVVQRAKRFFMDKTKAKASKILDRAKGNADNITLKMILESAGENDKVAVGLLAEAGDYLGAKAAFLINLFNPDAVVIGRGIEKFGEAFMDALRASVKKWAYEESLKVARIAQTSIGEDSIACGAASLVMQQVFARI